MIDRTKLLFTLTFLLIAVGLYDFYYLRTHDQFIDVSDGHRLMSSAFPEQWAAIQAADAMADAGERCRWYPDAPWLHWEADALAAFCQVPSFHFVPLSELKAALDAGHAEFLDRTFRGYEEKNLSDPASHALVMYAYKAFANTDPSVRDVVEAWVSAAPKSAYALTARGIYYMEMAQTARGTKPARDTPRENFESMGEYTDKGEAALAQDDKLLAAYFGLMGAGLFAGEHDFVEEQAKRALQVDPADELIYMDWANANEPRWGGSMQRMADIARLAQAHRSENLRLLQVQEKMQGYAAVATSIRMDNARALYEAFDHALATAPNATHLARAGEAALVAGEPERAIWYFSQAWRFSNDPQYLANRSRALLKIDRPDWAKASLAVAFEPREMSSDTLRSLAGAYWNLQMLDKAEPLYTMVLERNPRDEDALVDLSAIYMNSPSRPQLAKPLIARLIEAYPDNADAWYLDSMGKTGKDCETSLQKYLDLVDPRDSYEQDRIRQARARLHQ